MTVQPVATLADQIAEVKREIDFRRRVYPRMVMQEKMTASDAETHSMRMIAVLLTLEKLRDDAVAAALDKAIRIK